MIVDDTVENLKVLEGLLNHNGYTVRAFSAGGPALRAAVASPPELFLLDVLMPGMDGYELCAQLKASPETREVPVIFLSALGEVEDKVLAFQKGGVDYITKPFRHEDVLARVETHLKLSRLQQELRERNLQLEESLRKQRALERLRDDLVHMLVHDLRAPLTAISGNLDLFLDETNATLPEEDRQLLVRAHRSSDRLAHMISDILDVSKLESGQMEVATVACELEPLVREAVSAVEGAARGREVVTVPVEPPCSALCDPGLLGRVLINLIGNAVKFTPAGGRITVSTEQDAEHVKLSVTDTGPGIPAEFHGRIFEKFGQAGTPGNRVKHSTGLGLTFCKLAVEAQAGQLGLESAPGAGSTFWVRLPRLKRRG